MTDYTTVIGLEIHVQLNTQSKAFCADENKFGVTANTNISAVSLALPGTLPVLNAAQMHSAVKLGIAIESKINLESRFDRKNYFYPDLPKGYQITQENRPICIGGCIPYQSEGKTKEVRIHHIHMEEDAGKSTHELHDECSLVDYNRAGTPLLEIVTEPDLRSAEEVHDFIAAVQQLVRYLAISDGNMEEGSLRCDVNVSVMKKGSDTYGERCEIKNVNSKKFAKQAVTYESQRQIKLLEQGEAVKMTSLLFNPADGSTKPMRFKENANDYRYLPDPDLPPTMMSEKDIEEISTSITVLPWKARMILQNEYGLPEYDVEMLSREKSTIDFFLKFDSKKSNSATLSKFIINKILPDDNFDMKHVHINTIENITNFISLLDSSKVSKSAALNTLSDDILQSTELLDIAALAKEKDLIQDENQDFLEVLIDKVLAENTDKVLAYKKGKKGLIGFFMGQIMRQSQGKANPEEAEKILLGKLEQ